MTGVLTYDTPAIGVDVISFVRNLLRMLELPRWNLVFEGVNFSGSSSIPTNCSAALHIIMLFMNSSELELRPPDGSKEWKIASYCPQPDLTVGLTSHSDPGVITLLLQDQVGGLQVKHGDEWIDVKPIPGALVVNIGDILQIMSNDEYKSVDHRVLANPSREPRVSIAVFCNPSNRENQFGPLPELISADKPAVFRHLTFNEYAEKFLSEELEGKSMINFFRA